MKKKLINDEQWLQLEAEVRKAVTLGGTIALEHYSENHFHIPEIEDSPNPSTLADINTTFLMLTSLFKGIQPIANELGIGMNLYAEELEDKHKQDEREQLIQKMFSQFGKKMQHVLKRDLASFQQDMRSTISILIDSIDGTANYRAGIPLFCSSAGILIDGFPCIGAIFDAVHNSLYYGSIKEQFGHRTQYRAYVKSLFTGNVAALDSIIHHPSANQVYATHLTRSSEEKRNQIIQKLGKLILDSNGITMLNSGQLALAYVASGKIAGFINNHTHPHDVLAGEIILRAAGGISTTFNGKLINYKKDHMIEILAARDFKTHEKLRKLF